MSLHSGAKLLPTIEKAEHELQLLSHGLRCKTNRTLNAIIADRRFTNYFLQKWGINVSAIEDSRDHMTIISLDDEAVYNRVISNGSYVLFLSYSASNTRATIYVVFYRRSIDEFIFAYTNRSATPQILDETHRACRHAFNVATNQASNQQEDEDDQALRIERLTAKTFRSQLLNEVGETTKKTVAQAKRERTKISDCTLLERRCSVFWWPWSRSIYVDYIHAANDYKRVCGVRLAHSLLYRRRVSQLTAMDVCIRSNASVRVFSGGAILDDAKLTFPTRYADYGL